jgi:formamidopyrimidine-DNA glycosylase
MPEGPEVETIRIGLLPVVGRTIEKITIAKHPKYRPLEDSIMELQGSVISEIQRRGKFLVWFCKGRNDLCILNHLGMTGVWFHYSPAVWKQFEDPYHEYPHWKVHMQLDDDSHLLFVNVRTFGKFEVMTPEQLEDYPAIASLGPDILSIPFNFDEFIARIRGKNTKPRTKEIGKCLLDYDIIAGCGNIYKSEALFRAKINPFLSANEVEDTQLRVLGKYLSEVAHEAMKFKGSTLRDYKHVDGYSGLMQNNFRVYAREGESCLVCNTAILAEKQGGRTTFWCPKCQIMT